MMLLSSAGEKIEFSTHISMGFQFFFPAASTKTDYIIDTYTKNLQFSTHQLLAFSTALFRNTAYVSKKKCKIPLLRKKN